MGKIQGWQYLAAAFVLGLLVVLGAGKLRTIVEQREQAHKAPVVVQPAPATDPKVTAALREAVTAKGEAVAEALSSVNPALLTGAPESPQAVQFVSRVVKDPNIAYVVLLDGRGRTAAASDLKRASEPMDINAFMSVVVLPRQDGSADAEVRGPIFGADGAYIGGVRVGLKYDLAPTTTKP